MRRFFAFIIMAISLIACVGFTYQESIERTRYGLEYEGGNQVVYRIDFDSEEQQRNFDHQEAATIISDRLELSEVKDARVESEYDQEEGYYQVRISLTPNNSENLENVLRVVEATGSLSVCTTEDYCVDDLFDRSSAKVGYQSAVPYVTAEVTSRANLTSLISHAEENAPSGEDETINLVVWMDKLDDDTYIKTTEGDLEATKLQDKIVAMIPVSNFNQDTGVGVFNTLGYNSTVLSTDSAYSLSRVLNSKELDFGLTRLYTIQIDPEHSSNAAVIAVSVSIILACLLLICSYGWSGVAASVGIVVTMFLNLIVYNFFRLQFSSVVIMGLVTCLALCINMIVTYFEKFKEEIYKGRSLVKANQESYRRSVSTMIDSSVIVLILGIVTTLIARQQLKYFPIMVVIGSILSLVVCNLLTKWMMWWLLNNKFANKHINQFAINTKLIPDVNKQEGRKYFGKFANANPLGQKKKSLITAATALIISLGAIIGFSLAGSTFNYTRDFASQGRVEIISSKVDAFEGDNENVSNFFKNTPGIELDIADVNFLIQDDPDKDGDEEIIYITVLFDSPITDTSKIDLIKDTLLSDNNYFGDETDTKVYVTTTNPAIPQGTFNNSVILIAVSAGLVLVYFGIRFRYSLGIASFAVVVVEAVVTFGFFAITRIPTNAYLGMGIFAGLLVMSIMQISYFEKIKQLQRESKVKVTTIEQKTDIAKEALNSQIGTMLIVEAIMIGVSVLLLALAPSSLTTLILAFILATLIGFFGNIFVLTPIYLFLEKNIKFKAVRKIKKNVSKKRLESKKAKARATGAEPVEATIPGIND